MPKKLNYLIAGFPISLENINNMTQQEIHHNELFAANIRVVGAIAQRNLSRYPAEVIAEIQSRGPIDLGTPQEWDEKIREARRIISRPHLGRYVEAQQQIRARLREWEAGA